MPTSRPQLSVVLSTLNHKDHLAACLNGLARQTLDGSKFEVVLAYLDSTDGLLQELANLNLPFQTHVMHEDSGERVAALNRSLAACSGEEVLFLAEGCVPADDCLQRHLNRHVSSRGGSSIAVLGGQSATGVAELMLERYAAERSARQPETSTPEFFDCTNFSLPLEQARRVGGFDQRLIYGNAAERDLLIRGQSAGLRIIRDQAACAAPTSSLTIDSYRASQVGNSRGSVALYHKHAALLLDNPVARVSFSECHAQVRAQEVQTELLEETARELAGIDLLALESLAEPDNQVTQAIAREFAEIMAKLESAWTHLGLLKGLRDESLFSMQELVVRESSGDPFTTSNTRRLLAWPRWSDTAELDELMERVAHISKDGFATLVLRHEAHRDPEQSVAVAALQAAYARRYPGSSENSLEVLIESGEASRSDYFRWGRAVSALLLLGSEPRAFVKAIGAECLDSSAAVIGWRQRFEPITT